jgi:hypothetical protein
MTNKPVFERRGLLLYTPQNRAAARIVWFYRFAMLALFIALQRDVDFKSLAQKLVVAACVILSATFLFLAYAARHRADE